MSAKKQIYSLDSQLSQLMCYSASHLDNYSASQPFSDFTFYSASQQIRKVNSEDNQLIRLVSQSAIQLVSHSANLLVNHIVGKLESQLMSAKVIFS